MADDGPHGVIPTTPHERRALIERYGRSGWQWIDPTCREYRTDAHGRGLYIYDEEGGDWELLADDREFKLSGDETLALYRLKREGMGVRFVTAG